MAEERPYTHNPQSEPFPASQKFIDTIKAGSQLEKVSGRHFTWNEAVTTVSDVTTPQIVEGATNLDWSIWMDRQFALMTKR